jgi:hypothetical protein
MSQTQLRSPESRERLQLARKLKSDGMWRHLDDLEAARRETNSEQKAEQASQSMAPLYDDFLDVMNQNVDKTLQEQRAVPAYDDFLHLMKDSAEKAITDAPSYDDFLTALKQSKVEASKTPIPQYEDFLKLLTEDALKAQETRLQHRGEQKDNSQDQDQVQAKQKVEEPIVKMHNKVNNGVIAEVNPLDRIAKTTREGAESARRTVTGESQDRDAEERKKLARELRELQQEQKRKKQAGIKDPHKPLMARINVLRTQLCWRRPNLWEHEKCLRFLGIHCMKESTGEGICRKLHRGAREHCSAEDANPNFKEDYCALADALDVAREDDMDQDKDEAKKEAAVAEDKGEEVVQEDAQEKEADEALDDEEGDELDDELTKEDDGDDTDGNEKKAEAVEEAKTEGKVAESEKETLVDDSGEKGSVASGKADRDGDGTPDDEDAFPDDAKEWADTDGDGTGDNSDDDIDGDGIPNGEDAFPKDPKEWKDLDNDGIGDNSDPDRDNDGYENGNDRFPDDPTEWKDSDNDGVGDNKDAHPHNPNCHEPGPCGDPNAAAPVAPQPGSNGGGSDTLDPTTLDMDAKRPIPDQGYSEFGNGGPGVFHDNYYTWVGDWQGEFPEMSDSEKETLSTICKLHPDNTWCQRFKHHEQL